MLVKITDPKILEEYPHLSPPKVRQIDLICTPDGRGGAVYEMDPGVPEAGHGRLVECSYCNARIREGQPHTAIEPVPHTAYDMLTVIEPELEDRHYTGNLAPELDDRRYTDYAE